MKTYSLLRKHTREWWYHAQLRKQGRVKEARKLELASLRSSIKTLREAKHFSIGRGGATIQSQGNSWLSTHGNCELIECCKLMGIPGYDTRSLTEFDQIWEFTKSYSFEEKLNLAKQYGCKYWESKQ